MKKREKPLHFDRFHGINSASSVIKPKRRDK